MPEPTGWSCSRRRPGGHWARSDPARPGPELPLAAPVTAVGRAVDVPLIAAGGVATAAQVAAIVRIGAAAVAVGNGAQPCSPTRPVRT